MRSIYEIFADGFILVVNDISCTRTVYTFGDNNNSYGLEYRRNYTGLMARARENLKAKEGLFDCLVVTGNRYKHNITHYMLFKDLLQISTIDNCYKIWQGSNPLKISNNIDEQQALLTLALLMFEQEINWGGEVWQRYSHFSPTTSYPYKRPRDMIMGFLKIIFYYQNIDAIPNWQYSNGKKTTPIFGQGGYRNFNPNLKSFFTDLENDSSAVPLMSGLYLTKFRQLSNKFSNNPNYNN